jgi:FkbM family methyltransferase
VIILGILAYNNYFKKENSKERVVELKNIDCPVCEKKDVRNVEYPPLAEGARDRGNAFSKDVLTLMQSQTNLTLLEEIRSKWLKPPSESQYNLTSTTNASDMHAVRELHRIVLSLLNGKKAGFFIECGAFDGVDLSNTLHLEQNYGWTGLLVEADPKYFQWLTSKNRKAWSINACLAINPYPEKVTMSRIRDQDALTMIKEVADKERRRHPQAEEFDAQCFPLASILAAMGQTLNVDYLSLDVEGAELKILETIPWDFVYIKVISLEANEQRIEPLKTFLASKNYAYVQNVRGPWIHDLIFVHKQFQSQSSSS